VRTFVALNLPVPVRQRLAAALEPLRERDLSVRWLRDDGLHLTLKFLGDIEGSEVRRIDDVLRGIAAAHAPLVLELAGLGAFPSLRRASILWTGVTDEAGLMRLQRDLELALSRLGYPRETRPFRPHITVGRTRNGARPPDIERLAATFDYNDRAQVDTMELMRSHLGPGGSVYEPLLRVPLSDGGTA
jgi:RNA 2',3'-cyclic 3'-phosphodiesterase